MGKTRKLFQKRFKLTKQGKILHRSAGIGHGFVKNKISKRKKCYFKNTSKNVLIYAEYNK